MRESPSQAEGLLGVRVRLFYPTKAARGELVNGRRTDQRMQDITVSTYITTGYHDSICFLEDLWW